MSIAAAQYQKFLEQVVRDGFVYSFSDNGNMLIYRVGDHEVMPWWSSRERLEKIQASHEKYQKYKIDQVGFESFYKWLPNLERDQIHVGVNWSGVTLMGYDVAVKDLVAGLNYRMKEANMKVE